MPFSGYHIPLTQELAERLDPLSVFRRRFVLEQAIHKALDDAGWPRAGELEVPTSYWYVVLERRGQPCHVGPLTSEQDAQRCAASWRQTGIQPRITRAPVGPALTNSY